MYDRRCHSSLVVEKVRFGFRQIGRTTRVSSARDGNGETTCSRGSTTVARTATTSSSSRGSRIRSCHVEESNFDEWNGNPCDFDLGGKTSQCDGHLVDGNSTSRSTRIRAVLDGVNTSFDNFSRSHHRGTNGLSSLPRLFDQFSTYGRWRALLLFEPTFRSLRQLFTSNNSGSIRQSRSRSLLFRNSISFFRRYGPFPLRSRCHFIDSPRRSSHARRSCCSNSNSTNEHSSPSSRSFFRCRQRRLVVGLEEESAPRDSPGRIRWRFRFFSSTTDSFARDLDRYPRRLQPASRTRRSPDDCARSYSRRR